MILEITYTHTMASDHRRLAGSARSRNRSFTSLGGWRKGNLSIRAREGSWIRGKKEVKVKTVIENPFLIGEEEVFGESDMMLDIETEKRSTE